MEFTIKLLGAKGRLSTREPFLLADNEALSAVLECELQGDYITTLVCDKKRVALKGKAFEIPRDFLHAGSIEAQTSLYSRGVCVKSWTIEPIAIQEANEGFQGFPELDNLRTRLSALETLTSDYATLKQNVAKLTVLCKTNAEAIKELAEALKE